MKWLVPVLMLLFSLPAQASKLIAVLPLDTSNTKGKLGKEERVDLEEMLRDVATDALTSGGWTVLTGETTLQVLQDNGVDASKCGDQNCHLSMAREIKAEKFLSGNVRYVEGSFTASVRLIDTATGRILASQSIEGDTVKALRKDFRAKSADFFAKGGLFGSSGGGQTDGPVVPDVKKSGPQITKTPIADVVGRLIVTAKPKDAVRIDIVDPDGKKSSAGASYENTRAKPGRWKITASATGYEDETQEIDVLPDDVMPVKFELKALGGLSVKGAPAGAAVTVTGPGQFKDEGGLPWEATGLRRGTYKVRIDRAGYQSFEQSVEVKPSATATVDVTLLKQSAKSANAPAQTATGECAKGTVTGDNGDAFYGQPGLESYIGRVSHGATFTLETTQSFINPKYPTLSPLIRIKVLTNEYSAEIGKVGYIDLDKTNMARCVTGPVEAPKRNAAADCSKGTVTGENGDAFYGRLVMEDYLGRVRQGDTFTLVEKQTYTNTKYPTLSPLVHIKVLTSDYSSEIGKEGYIDLDKTDMKDCVLPP